MEWNEEPMDGVDPLADLAAEPKKKPGRRPPRGPIQSSPIFNGGTMQGIAPFMGLVAPHIAAQGAHLGGMINQVQDAIQRENDSRVAQAREQRRMDHEKEMKRMELDAMLARIQQARGQLDG